MNEELFAEKKYPQTEFTDSFSEEVWRSTYKYHADETINDTLKRVATAIAEVEDTEEKQKEWTTKFYDMLSGFKALPGGRTIANAGAGYNSTTLANCFVAPRRNRLY
jgi:ribonucleoside-diphosphate reductase alpha chain